MAIAILAAAIAIGLAIDGVRAAHGIARADAIAEETARAGGQALDPVALTRGQTVLDPQAAAAAARAYLDTLTTPPESGQPATAGTAAAEQVVGTVQVLGPDRIRVEVTLTRPTVLLGLIGRPEVISHGSAEAVLVPITPAGAP